MYHPTKLKFSLFLILAIHFLLCTPILGQQNQQTSLLDVPNGKIVVLKIPSKLIGFKRVSTWSGNISYGAIIEQSDKSGIMVGGIDNWRNFGWTLMRQLTIHKVSREKNHTLVELKDPFYDVKLRFDNTVKDLNAAFREVAFVGLLSEFETSDYYQKELVEKVLPRVFSGNLSSIPTTRKLNLLKELKYIDSAITTATYKGDTYLSVDMGGDVEIFNTIRVNQSQRIGHALNKRVLSYFKRTARILKFSDEVDGIKISILIPYKNFVTEASMEPSYDRIEIYASMDTIRQFADDELTNQEFVEESVLLVNGSRMRIPNIESL